MRRSIIGILSAILFVTCGLACVQPRAVAAESQTTTTESDRREQVLSLSEATAVVTDTSGYHLKVTITNTSDEQWSAGRLSLTVNSGYTFTSRTDMQEWAQSQNMIPTPNEIGTVQVQPLSPGQSTTVSINAKADNEALKSIMAWGPKPLLAVYSHDDEDEGLRSFLTRSTAGLNTIQTPAMRITMVAPLASEHWQVSNDTLTSMVKNRVDTDNSASDAAKNTGTANTANSAGTTNTKTSGNGNSSGSGSEAVTLAGDHTRFDRSLNDVLTKHPKLQTVADPAYLDALNIPPKVSALMQPAAFDITSYAARNDAQSYENAGVGSDMWSASAAVSQYRNAIGDAKANASTVAWQGRGHWTLQALTEARRQGYTTVISTADFESDDNDTVRTGTNVVSTDAGDVTVLVEQRELSRLAQGTATSRKARAESSEAGRLARFVAQSAFYQMEQPYTERNLLVNFGFNASSATLDSFMSAVESSTWLEATDLETLGKATPQATGDEAADNAPTESGISQSKAASLESTIATLSANRAAIVRFRDGIMTGGSDDGRKAWINRILTAQSTMALHAFTSNGSDTASSAAMVSGSQQLSDALLNSISLAPSETITMVSETATMPVTVSNATPFSVEVNISSITDSSEIATSRRTTIKVPAHSEAQATFRLRAATSSSATATITLEDRSNVAFGQPQQTAISCILKISDMTGFIIIGAAVVLGLLGLWRQFHRKKDPDE
nr:DUF6049 family protein [Bifidobacterium pongonis]